MNRDLSEKQLNILNFIKSQILDKGYPPAVREICDAVGLKSTSTVHGHLERLEKKGYIRRDPSKPRAIEIIDETFMPSQKEMVSVPIIGKVAAGEPLLAVENIDDYFPIPMDYMPNQQSFMLRVQGNSMIEAGIFNEDLILVQQQNHAIDKDIVVALLDDSVTVKRFFKETDHVRLQPENSTMDPIIVNDITILGKVIGLFRQF